MVMGCGRVAHRLVKFGFGTYGQPPDFENERKVRRRSTLDREMVRFQQEFAGF